MSFVPRGLPTGIGSLPFKDEKLAVSFVLENLPELPFWPQLPRKDHRESMYVQYSEGLPGVTFSDRRMFIDTGRDLIQEMEEFYQAYLEGKGAKAAFGPGYAEGFYAFLKHPPFGEREGLALAVKGQVTGPVSFGLAVTDQNKRLILYDQIYMDMVVKNLQLKARWQEERLRELHPQTIIFVDEPYLSTYGSGYFNYDRETVVRYIREVMEGIQGLKGVHCCGNTDWSILLSTPVDIISFDAYAYSKSFSLYAQPLADFLARGGVIAWGIVPATQEEAKKEDARSLLARMEEGMGFLRAQGLSWTELVEQALITPACGLGSQGEEGAGDIFRLTREVSDLFREKYRLD
ncbi:MAG: methionine synthase [Firmicutes bacterium]|nr:methionine synthase [Bacillota bacterium]